MLELSSEALKEIEQAIGIMVLQNHFGYEYQETLDLLLYRYVEQHRNIPSTKNFIALIRKAIKQKETVVERIMLFCDE